MTTAVLLWVFRTVIYWFAWLLWYVIDPFLAAIVYMVPSAWVYAVASFVESYGPYIEVANMYVPLSEFAIVFPSYFAFLAAFVSVKFILKLIPTIG